MSKDSAFSKKEMIRIARKLIRKNGKDYFSKRFNVKGISISYNPSQKDLIAVYGIAKEDFYSFLFEVSEDKGKVYIIAVYEEIETQKELF